MLRCVLLSVLLFIIQPLNPKTFPQETPNDKSDAAVVRTALPSGLRLIVAERAKESLATILLRVRVGSGSESPTENGLSHFIEHMVFKGGGETRPGDIDAAIEALGGEIAARTTRDFTEYAITLPKENLLSALRLIAELVQSPEFREADMELERRVILSEMKAAAGEPAKLGFRQIHYALCNEFEPYYQPLMGTEENVRSFTPADLQRFWQRWYRPENMTLIIVGEVKTPDIKAVVAPLFPPATTELSGKPIVTAFTLKEGVSRAPELEKEAQATRELVTLLVAFRTPPADDGASLPGMEALIPLLAYGKQGHLYERLVEKDRLAFSVAAEYLPGQQSGMVLLTLITTPTMVARLEQAVEEEIRRMREDSLTPSEIEGSKAVLLNRVRYESETVEGQARHLAYLDTYAPLMDEKLFQERVEAVSVEMVRQNLLRYLTPLNYAVAVVGPPAPPPTPTTAEKTGGYLR